MTTSRKGRDRTVGDAAPTGTRPEPVLQAVIAPAATAAVGLLVAFGVHLSDDQRNALLGAVAALIPLVGLVANWWARRKVTPLADPRDDHGRTLMPYTPPPTGYGPAGGLLT